MIMTIKYINQNSLERRVSLMNDKYEVVKFVDNQFELDVRADKENETVWRANC